MLQTPRDQLPGFPATEAAYREYVAAEASKRGRALIVDPATLQAIVEFGRWIALCPYCNAGIAIHPAWAFAGCLGCWHVFASIEVPADWQDIERVLLPRPMGNQYWYTGTVRSRFFGGGRTLPSETLEDLLGENAARGLPVPLDLRPRIPVPPAEPVLDAPVIDEGGAL